VFTNTVFVWSEIKEVTRSMVKAGDSARLHGFAFNIMSKNKPTNRTLTGHKKKHPRLFTDAFYI